MGKFDILNYRFDSNLNRNNISIFMLDKSFEELLSKKINKHIQNIIKLSLNNKINIAFADLLKHKLREIGNG